MSLAPDDPRHGTYTGYNNHGCRCENCRAAWREYHRARGTGGYKKDLCACGQPKRATATRCRPCEDAARAAQHGTESGYTGGCRCDDCMDAAKDARARRRRTPNVKVHNRNGYCNGCRCDVCREGQRVYAAGRKKTAA